MIPKILSFTAAAVIAVGTVAVPAVAATPAAPNAAKPGTLQLTEPNATGRVVPVRHYYRNRAYCSRQYRLGFVLGKRGARLFFNQHCHPRWRGHDRRTRQWDRGYRRDRHHRNHRWNHRSYQNQR